MTDHLTVRTERLAPTEARDFVDAVRGHLADLDRDEQQELTAGLEADLAEVVAERGTDALGDPVAYARELRIAAGHAPKMAERPGGRGVRQALLDAIDSTHAGWDRLLDSFPGDLRGFVAAFQPVWWVLRAFVAWMVVQDLRAPSLIVDAPHLVVLGALVVVSVALGLRRWGVDRLLTTSLAARLLLVALNVFALTMTPGAFDRLEWYVAGAHAWQYC